MNPIELLVVVLIGILAVSESDSTTDYCSASLCRHGKHHIACNNTGDFGESCSSDRKLLSITPEIKSIIVNRHNEHRNSLAGGKLPGFEQCPRMATMQWEPELAKLAELNVKTCKYGHDACHNTDKHKHSGQNIGQKSFNYSPYTDPDEGIITHLIDAWWNEYKDTSMKEIKKYPKKFKAVIGHFTVMAVEGSDRVGCAVSTYNFQHTDQNTWYAFYLVCDYGENNMVNLPIYSNGKAVSKCETGANPSYKSLCSDKEVYGKPTQSQVSKSRKPITRKAKNLKNPKTRKQRFSKSRN